MKKMTLKLIIVSFIILIISSIIPNIIWAIFGEGRPRHGEIDPGWILLGGILTVFTSVTLYSIIINKIVLRRIKNLNVSTKKVINGDYKVTVNDKHKDEISQLSHSFNEMTKALRQNQYISKNFIRNFSHEYKTPLSTIKGYAELIQDEDNLSNDTKEYLEIIIDESKRLSQLSYHMLLISQIDHKIILPKDDAINITEELRNVIQTKQLMFEEKELSFDLEVEDIHMTTNQGLIYQVFSNIIDNAIKYTSPKETINIHFKKEDSQIVMVFTNPTMLKDVEEKQIFSMFYTNHTHTSKSNGIGLSLVKKIIEKLNGDINVSYKSQIFELVIKLPIQP
ncbi:MAG TPA: HAMP domain-containing sensor histidine kinase [Candidatus Izemoplasmatales bacterium]|nr:HAMP domain-containing sensor histidine kinase [Candidatus Izemoplasmatales bacterium]